MVLFGKLPGPTEMCSFGPRLAALMITKLSVVSKVEVAVTLGHSRRLLIRQHVYDENP